MDILQAALSLKAETIAHRRHIHQYAEIGMELSRTTQYVDRQLQLLGCEVQHIGGGIVTTIGSATAGRVLLLRADMDALPMREESGLEFASQTPYAHCCGHDLHTAMLLSAAKILKERQDELGGAVKLMFQPAEETGEGAAAMVEAGVLMNPPVDAVAALHVNARAPLCQIDYGMGNTFASNDCLQITVLGKSGHGARPAEAIDPIRAAAQLCGRFADVAVSTSNPVENVIFTVTSFHGGNSYNIIPDTAELKASLRTYSAAARAAALEKIRADCSAVERQSGVTCRIETVSSTPSVFCEEQFTRQCLQAVAAALPGQRVSASGTVKVGSEDFAYLSQKIPKSAYLFLGAGQDCDTGYAVGQHNPGVLFNEDALAYGVAMLVACAFGTLNAAPV